MNRCGKAKEFALRKNCDASRNITSAPLSGVDARQLEGPPHLRYIETNWENWDPSQAKNADIAECCDIKGSAAVREEEAWEDKWCNGSLKEDDLLHDCIQSWSRLQVVERSGKCGSCWSPWSPSCCSPPSPPAAWRPWRRSAGRASRSPAPPQSTEVSTIEYIRIFLEYVQGVLLFRPKMTKCQTLRKFWH